MLTVEESVVIDRRRDEVFEFFTDPENVTTYSSNIVEYEHISGEPRTVGAKHHGTVKVAGKKLEFTDDIVEFEDGKRMATRSEDATIPYSLSLSFDGDGGSTTVTWRQEVESLKGFFKFADPIVMKMYSHDVRSNLAKAKTLLEAQ